MNLRLASLAAADGAVLALFRPDVGALRHGLGDLRQWLADDGADHVLAGLAGAGLWLTAAWVAVGLLASCGTRLPGAAGRVAGRVARVALPAVVRRVVVGSVGLGVVLAPASSAVAAPPSGHPVVSAAMRGSAVGTSVGTAYRVPTPLPGPAWPSSDAPHHPAPAPRPGPRPAPRRDAGSTQQREVTVSPGDCLWLLAARRLGPDASDPAIAGYVPRLFAANRSVVGADPDVVVPGQHLVLPPVSQPEESS